MPDPTNPYADAVAALPDPGTDNPYAKVVDQFAAAQEQAVRGAVSLGAGGDPARAARAQQVGEALGLPPEIVAPNLDALEGRARFESVPFARLIEQNPRLAAWLSDRNNAAIGAGDVPALIHLDNAARIFAAPTDAPAPPDNRESLPWMTGVVGRYTRLNAFGGIDALLAVPASLEYGIRRLFGADMPDGADPGLSPLATIYHDQDILRAEARAAQTYRESTAQAIAGVPIGLLSNPLNVVPIAGAEAATASALARGATQAVASRAALTGASMVMGEQSAIQALADGLQRQQQARATGQTGPILPTGRDLTNAAVQGAIAYYAGYAGGLRGILRGFNPAPFTAGGLVADTAVQGLVGAAQGAAATTAGSVIQDGRLPGAGDVAHAAIVGGAGNAAVAAGFGSGHLAAQELHARVVDAADATAAAGIMAKAGAALASSKAFQLNGSRVLGLLRQAIGTGTGEVYLQAEDLPKLAAAAKVPEQVLQERLGISADDLTHAQATRAAIPVDVTQVLGEMAKGGHGAVAEAVDRLRIRPDAPNLAEANAFAESLPEEFQRVQAPEPATPEQTATERVAEDVRAQLLASGMSHDRADANAALWAARYGARAYWWNRSLPADAPNRMDPWTEYQRNPVGIQRALPETLTDNVNAFGAKLRTERQARAERWAAQDKQAAQIDAQRQQQADAGAADLRTRAHGEDGQRLIDQAVERLSSEAQRTGRIPSSTDIQRTLGADYGFKADASVKITPEQETAGKLFAAAMRHRGYDLRLLGEEAALAVAKAESTPKSLAQRIGDGVKRMFGATAPRVLHQAKEDSLASRAVRAVGPHESGLERHPGASPGSVLPDANQGKPQILESRQGSIRGSFESGRNIIRLFEAEDLSTFAHESGHAFAEMLRADAARPDAPRQIKDDWQTILDFTEATDGFGNAQHERFARAWEAYLHEGKAPAPGLAGVFQRFAAWMALVYKNLAGLSKAAGHEVKLTDQIRGVMDRMLASQEEITAAQAEQRQAPLFAESEIATAAGLGDAASQEYMAQVSAARDAAAQAMTADLLRAEERRKAALASDRYNAIADEVRAEVDAQGVYQAIAALKARETGPGGEPLPGLDRDTVKAIYSAAEGEAAKIPGQLGRMGVLAKQGEAGIHPDLVAGLYGFDSGDALMRAMASARKPEALIRDEAQVRLRERHPDLLPTAGEITQDAQNAIHGAPRAAVLRAELIQLGRRVGKTVSTRWAEDQQGQMRRLAEQRVGTMQVARIKPDAYRAAERKAAAEALEAARKAGQAHAAGRTAEADRFFGQAYVHKQREAYNFELYRAARAAAEQATKMGQALKAATQPDWQARIGKAGGWEWTVTYPDGSAQAFGSEAEATAAANARPGSTWQQTSGYLEQINAILERFDMKPVSAREAQRRRTLAEWQTMMTDQGVPADLPALPEGRQAWNELTVDELRAVHDAVQQIAHLARNHNKLLAEAAKVTFGERRTALVQSIAEHFRGDLLTKTTGRGIFDRVKDGASRFWTSLESLGDIVNHMDGGEDGGLAWQVLKRPFDEAATKRAGIEQQDTAKLHDAFAAWESAGDRGRVLDRVRPHYVPEIGQSITRLQAIMLAVQLGNEGNKARLLDGEGWTESQLQAAVGWLDAHDGALAQAIIDTMDGHRSALFAQEQRITGVRPQAVEASPFTIGGQTFKGGYFPIIYDELKSSGSAREKLKEAADMTRRGLFGAPKPSTGNLKARGEGTGRQLLIDTSAVNRGLQRVYNILAYREPLVDATRMLRQDEVRTAIEGRYGKHTMLALDEAMIRIAGSDAHDLDAASKFVAWLQRNAGTAAMGHNVWTAVQNITGFTQAMARVGTLPFLRACMPLVGDAGNMQSLRSFVMDASPYMRRRFVMHGERVAEELKTGLGALGRDMPDFLRPHAMMQAVDQLVALPTWKAAYDTALASGIDHAEAVLRADEAVTDALSNHDSKDKAAIFEGGPLMRALTTFGSYFNRTHNLTRRAFRAAGADTLGGLATLPLRPASAAALGWQMGLLYVFPVAMALAGLALLRPNQKRDREPLAGRMTEETLGMVATTIPVLREFSAGLAGQQYRGPAGMRGMDTINRLLGQIRQGEADRQLGRSAIDTLGLLSGLPTTQAQRTLDGVLYNVDQGSVDPRAPLFGPPRR